MIGRLTTDRPLCPQERIDVWHSRGGGHAWARETERTSLTQRDILDMAIGVYQMQIKETGTGKGL